MTLSLKQLIPHLCSGLHIPADRLLQAFRPATASDLSRIMEFRRQVSGDVWWDDGAYVRWRYFDSGPLDSMPPRYWIFEREGEIIGGVCIEPVVLVVDGQPHAAVRTMDIMVRPDFDGRGLGVLMSLLLFEQFPIALVAGTNERSHHLVSRLMHHTLDLHLWKLLVRSRDFISRHLNLGVFAGPVAAVGDSILAIERAWRRGRSPGRPVVRELEVFDEQVAALSRASEGEGAVLVRRSAAYLDWRFVKNPRCRYRVHGAYLDSTLLGYMVSTVDASGQNPTPEGTIADWLSLPAIPGRPDPLPALTCATVDALIGEGASVIRCLAYGAQTVPLVGAAGLRSRPGEGVPFFVRAKDASLQRRLSSGTGWFLTGCDFDVE